MAFTLTEQFFTEREAWNIFRLAAFGEAIGWTLLITGIIYKYFGLPNGSDVLKVLGQTHGTLFFAYFVGLLAVARSLRLSRRQFVMAAAMSVPPYGTLIYEKYLAYIRRREAAKSHREVIVRAIIFDGKKLLAVQPKRGTFWCLPGGKVEANEAAEEALKRLITDQLGLQAKATALRFTSQYRHHGQLRLELFYDVSAQPALRLTQLTALGRQEYDELAWIHPKNTVDLRPELLQTIRLIGKAE